MITISISRAKNELTQIIHAVETGPPVELTRHGKAAAVLLSVSDYDALIQNKVSFSLAYDSFRAKYPNYSETESIFESNRSEIPGREVDL